MEEQKKCARQGMRGSVLIAVIWTLSLLSIFTLSITRRVSAELVAAKWIRESVISRSLAKAGIERALFEIQMDEFLTFDALNEPWASNDLAFKEIALGGGSFTVSCGAAAPSRYGACDESARINLNTADEATMVNLFMTVLNDADPKAGTAIAHAILDWRDGDDTIMMRGAEKNYYKALARPYAPRNADFQSVEELQMVKGITNELYNLVKDYVTVYTDGKVNFNTATLTTLQALGLTASAAQGVLIYRAGEDGVVGTEDDGIFQAVGAITSSMSAGTSLSGEDFALISNVISAGNASVKSDGFRIRSVGRISNKSVDASASAPALGVVCVLKRDGSVLYWWEGMV